MEKYPLRAVLFDVDGTLMDTARDVGVCVNRALAKNGFPTVPAEIVGPSLGGSIYDVFRHFVPEDIDPAALDRIIEDYLPDYEVNFAVETVPFPGAQELLTSLQAAGIRLGVISNKTEEATRQMMEHFFPDITFELIWGQKPGRPIKPDPQSGLEAAAFLDLPPEQILYLGDSESDILYARRCGFFAAGAGWGYRGVPALEGAGADRIFDSLPALLPAIV